MSAFVTKTIQQIRGFIILGGLGVVAIPIALILSSTVFVVILLGLGFFVAEALWKRVMWVRIKLSDREELVD